MLKRSWPRSRSACEMANGNTSATWPLILPVWSSSSSLSATPAAAVRDTVPATSGCAELLFGRNELFSYGSYRGASCISWRHPEASARKGKRPRAKMLILNLHHLCRVEPREKQPRGVRVELGVAGFDREEELVLRGQLEAWR